MKYLSLFLLLIWGIACNPTTPKETPESASEQSDEPEGFGDIIAIADFSDFLTEFQAATKSGDKEAILSYFTFPLGAAIPENRTMPKIPREEFAQFQYNHIFVDEIIRKKLLDVSVRDCIQTEEGYQLNLLSGEEGPAFIFLFAKNEEGVYKVQGIDFAG